MLILGQKWSDHYLRRYSVLLPLCRERPPPPLDPANLNFRNASSPPKLQSEYPNWNSKMTVNRKSRPPRSRFSLQPMPYDPIKALTPSLELRATLYCLKPKLGRPGNCELWPRDGELLGCSYCAASTTRLAALSS